MQRQPLIVLGLVVVVIGVAWFLTSQGATSNDSSAKEGPAAYEIKTYDYAESVIISLGLATEARDKVIEEPENPDDIYLSTLDLLTDFRQAAAKLSFAASTLEIYASSTDPLIVENSLHYRESYLRIAALLEASAKNYENLLKAQTEEAVVDFMSNSSQLSTGIDAAWKSLAYVTAEFAFVLVDQERLVDGGVHYLKITASERQALIESLDSSFGPEIQGGIQAGQHAIFASAAAIRNTLTDEWKSADE